MKDDLLSHYDFMPTLLDVLGLPNPEASLLPGRSFAPLLRGERIGSSEDQPVFVFDEVRACAHDPHPPLEVHPALSRRPA